ncbi:MAG TPA: Dabb family protein [Candidatus Ozemobacteraceae bacterium]|nr:Dabb family protein [Candidatus Ozemobacteraceae bacterium]
MITHIVFFKLFDRSAESLCRVRDRILEMHGRIPVMKHLEAGADIIRSERAYDVALVAHFESRADLQTYIDHPVHQEFVQFIRPLRESTISVDYEQL